MNIEKLGFERPAVIAHRGFSAEFPENTMLAFEKAVSVNADMIELDICITKDYQFVVIHDDSVDATTNGIGAVRDLTFEEIRKLSAGKRGGGEKTSNIPLLRDVLCEFGSKIFINIEIKKRINPDGWSDEKVIECLVKEITGSNVSPDTILISSFDRDYLKIFRRNHGTFKLGYLWDTTDDAVSLLGKDHDLIAHCISFHPEISMWLQNKDKEDVVKHIGSKRVFAWSLENDSMEFYNTLLDETSHINTGIVCCY